MVLGSDSPWPMGNTNTLGLSAVQGYSWLRLQYVLENHLEEFDFSSFCFDRILVYILKEINKQHLYCVLN